MSGGWPLLLHQLMTCFQVPAAILLTPTTPWCCSQAGQEGPFILRMFSSTALEVEQLPSPFSLVLGERLLGA
jgi:hypothetical protein